MTAQVDALRLLGDLGWRYLSAVECVELRGGTREVLLKPRLIEFLQTRRFDYKGVLHPLSPGSIDQILRELSTLSFNDGLLAANKRIYAKLTFGITVTEFMPDGKHQTTIPIIDWANVSANLFDVTEEPKVLASGGAHVRAPSIVGYVNGIPLVVIEAKQPQGAHGDDSEAMVLEGINQHRHNQLDGEIPNLFAYAHLLLAISQTDGRYGTTRTPTKHWTRWSNEEEFAERANDRDRLLASLLTPMRLLELLRGFVLFDLRMGKVIARHQQFFGVRALLKRLRPLRADGSREGGVVWHTTGSGKSFTMVFLTKALLLDEALKASRVVVVTDRRDLEDQLKRNFMSGGAFGSMHAAQKEGERSKALSGRDLAKRIGHGTERITFALVQKFNIASGLADCRNDSPNFIVLVDEGHRSHGGEMHERMRKALPRAAYVAFTGTPLLKDEKTAGTFGSIVHAYTMLRAVDDRTVAPLLYEERVPELKIDAKAVDHWFDKITTGLSDARRDELKKKHASRDAIYGAAHRINLIAWDIATHFSENIKKISPGLKGQIATASKRDAIRYKKALDETGLVSSVVVMSAPDVREGDVDADEETRTELHEWWARNVIAVHRNVDEYERSALRAFGSDSGPDLLIVVDRLLTGFDEPRNAVLYIDKPLKGHNLIQAVARVNRLHDAKRFGLLVDYRGILKELDTALREYQQLETRTQGGFDVVDLEGLYRQIGTEYQRLPALRDEVWSFFRGVEARDDPEQLRPALSPRLASDGLGGQYDERQKLRDDFSAALTEFGGCLQTALASRSFFEDRNFSEEMIASCKQDLGLLMQVRRMARQDAIEEVDSGQLDEQLRRLVDEQVTAPELVSESLRPYTLKLGIRPEPAEAWSEEKARSEADLIRTRLRKTIEVNMGDDPYAQKVFSDLLKSAIAEAEAMFDHPRKQYALLREFEERVNTRAMPGTPETLADSAQARAYFGAILLALGEEAFAALDSKERAAHADHALVIHQTIQQAVAEQSLNPQNVEAIVRKKLLTRLHAALGLEKTNEVIRYVLQITRVGISRNE
jgi:type I restriction enzyme R subunit